MTLVAKLFSETGSPPVQSSRKYLRVKAVNFTGVNYWVERCSEKFRVLLKRGNGKRKTIRRKHAAEMPQYSAE